MTQSKNNRWLFGLIGTLVVAIGLVSGYIVFQQLTAPSLTDAPRDTDADGVINIDPPRPMPAFTLTNQRGEPISRSDLAGRATLITFGFTNCPDICPLTLQELDDIADDLGSVSNDVNLVFISVDGERDTPQRLQEFFETQGVSETVIGITGNPDDVQELGTPYNLEFSYGDPAADGSYNVNHTAGTFLLDEDLNLIKRYVFGTPNSVIADDVEALVTDT